MRITDSFRIAVKAFIVHDGKLLILKRRSKDTHKPNEWDIPGGRLEPGENPFSGLQREAKEETNLDIEIIAPLGVQHFVRDDKQQITMIIFLCKSFNDSVQLSDEHTGFAWKSVHDPASTFPAWLDEVLSNYLMYYSDKIG
ncbi:NUDIX domain-containing protein [Candidatus Woesearchaeota archaeon]|nr:NUDIX domain-containing protein [Candidatus Woesearchaeota archaeon]